METVQPENEIAVQIESIFTTKIIIFVQYFFLC